jgi:hypothetical protein
VTLVSYELADRPAALIVDLAAPAAGWRIGDREVDVAEVLAIAPPDEVERLARRVMGEVRGHAAAASQPSSELLRQLAAAIWRDYRRATSTVVAQPPLPGV